MPENGTHAVTGTYTISGHYCLPPSGVTFRGVLQVLVHGDTYNKTYYSGLGQGAEYDYETYATSQGYATLALDTLGHGDNPQRPNPLLIVEGPMQMEVTRSIILAAKAGTLQGVAQ
jgi:hypothetical protein